MATIPFAEWRPDQPALSQWAREALNVVAGEESYRPLNSLLGVSNALVARAQGAAWFRGAAGQTRMFAGDATRLYLLSGTTWSSVPQLASTRTITAITKANPGKVTATGHGYNTGDIVQISGVVGMTPVNGRLFTVTVVDVNNFTIGVDTSGFTAYTSGGSAQKATSYQTPADGTWQFAQFGSLAIAVNGVDPPQKFDLTVGTNFSALGGSPPVASFIAIVRDFVLLGRLGSTPQRIQWSGLNNAEAPWVSDLSTQADLQDLPDGGNVTGLVGGEYGLIFQESAVRRMTYEGAPVVFRLDKIANDIGASVSGSVAGLLDMAFFLHKSGFYMVQGGQTVTPIGRGKVDKTFWAEFDETNQFRCSSAIDPVRGLYVVAYPANGSNGTPNRLLIYNWRSQRWSRAILACELVFGGVSQQGYTLEQLDAFGDGTVDGLPYPLDSSFWSGTVSLLLFGFDTSHKSGSFSGASLDATVETSEFNPGNGKRSVIRSCRPLIDGGAPAIAVGARETQQAAVSYGTPIGLTSAGLAPLYTSGRYFRVRATIPGGSTWSNAQGIDDLDVRLAGAQ
jgi:hypothetical protein